MSSYKDLKNFKNIFNREDFSFISDERNIEAVSEIIQSHLNFPDGNEKNYQEFLLIFLQNLVSFYQWTNGKKILPLTEGYTTIQTEVTRAINLLKESELKRRSISKGYLRKFKDNFLNAYTIFLVGVRMIFDPEYAPATGVNKEQIIRYILDDGEGLGKKFAFNGQGKHAFANKVVSLNRQELLITERLLLRPGANQIRTSSSSGWLDLGINASAVRIVGMAPKFFGKQKIYYLFRISEHREYEAQLRSPSNKCVFKAA